ncbi:MAG: hypothetical protein RI972_246 [Pseudomonadota bacterium]
MSKPDDDGAGFFSRWSRRKAQVHQEGTQPAEAVAPQRAVPPATAAVDPRPVAPGALGNTGAAAAAADSHTASASSASSTSSVSPASPAAGSAEPASAPKPTLQDVEQLDAKSDYRSFVARDVDPQVRNAAFKKLFHSDPHFNVMDGLDVYIDDYNTPNPLPVAIMKTLVQARAMGLIDDELKEQDPPDSNKGSEKDSDQDSGEGAVEGSGEGSAEGAAPGARAGSAEGPGEGAGELGAGEPGAEAPLAQQASADASTGPAAPPVLVEIKLVPDQASNDEPLSAAPSAAAAVEGTVVPFPRRPGSADPA